ncbi:MAG: enoyl-CoA hydratase-related protein [Eubacteriaceae bacterium]|nr:enoyl-CoA hydratase-related protein [Eubacteriaceae bacterium]
MYNNLKFEVKEGIAYITMSRPKALNALNTETLNDLHVAFHECQKNDEIKVVILTGEGKAFVAGADIAEMCKLNAQEGRAYMYKGHAVMNQIEALQKPVIAAVNGYALGGGCELSMACDIRIASENALFGQPEVNLGIIPGFGGTQRLTRLVGKGMAKYIIMQAKNIKGPEAKQLGLAEDCVAPEDLMPTAEKVARTIMSKAPIAVAQAKVAINVGADLDMKTASQFEIECMSTCFSSEDKAEGMTAFLEKRDAVWKNK